MEMVVNTIFVYWIDAISSETQNVQDKDKNKQTKKKNEREIDVCSFRKTRHDA